MNLMIIFSYFDYYYIIFFYW